ncbi:TAXI family TRAP transporter solute-binding subunit [Methylobacterium sp. J-072]|uniref:TAXI family TRAP transporter solute-binding subunit n=1 Tax=Methylobacterium sp. J-072 TaxID=2836651 RepID=UPI001FBA212B|nr:TAXI family TRAP transporter solute-binding subunit [Methylobacterium sp. J-072]MCJ2094688.1 TAXI family TRAP transporter solute-binding subunit [Methylobacterium sp. J-072]
MKRRPLAAAGPTRRAGLLAALGLVLVRSTYAAEPTRVVLATATPGGGFPAFGDAFAAAIRAADPELAIETCASGGSAENIGLLRAGRVDLALVQGEYAYPALAEPGGLTVLAPMYPSPGLFAVPAASPIRAVEDLRGRTVVLGTHKSGLTVMGRSALQASGLDPERDIRPILLDQAGDGPPMVRDGHADALWGGGLGWPGFLAMAQVPGGARFFGPSEAGIARLAQPGAALQRLIVPPGSFPGQSAAIETVGSWSLVLARPGFEADTAYRIVRALARADMVARHPQGADSHPKNLSGLVPATQLNPGTRRYLGETGVVVR